MINVDFHVAGLSRSVSWGNLRAINSIMTSSAPEVSGASHDTREDVEKHHDQGSQAQSSAMETGVSPGTVAPNFPYVTPPQLGADNAMAAAAFPYPDPYYRSMFAPYDTQAFPAQPYPAQPMVHLQLMGIQQAGVPLVSDTVEEPVFVNAKQYHGILRRRQSRAKAESENKLGKSRKPYLHESRHQHALRRARGNGGRFLNAKKDEDPQKEVGSGDNPQVNVNLSSGKSDTAEECTS
ncbi:hypothetical protein Leryth_011005 [Lithospermum erythrorhizon]|nr:hypothetical protein Leryth_011005 [Lithospermum erythrorhizon]